LSSAIDHQFPDAEPVWTTLMNRDVWAGNTMVMIPVAPVPLATGPVHVTASLLT
jgi:hypothetical protein